MEKLSIKSLNQDYYFTTLKNGLEIYYIPKKGFKQKYASLTVDFGSNDLEFVPIGLDKPIKVNDGIAHFLEHKMFEQEDGVGALERFSKLGVSANAYTNYTQTSYLFSGVDNFYESLKFLISYVQSPFYTEENVEKEKGIIAQEIKMYEDMPTWTLMNNARRAMYKNNNVRISIAGSVESIYRITPDELYDCYNTFYNPANMKLVIVGDIDIDEMLKAVEEVNDLSIPHQKEIIRIEKEEPECVSRKLVEDYGSISMPLFLIGYKDRDDTKTPIEKLKKEIISDIIFEAIFSEGSRLYDRLYRSGLLMGDLKAGYLCQKGYEYGLVYGMSIDPKKVKEAVDEEIKIVKKEGISLSDFDRLKKKFIGAYLMTHDSVSGLANNFVSYLSIGANYLDYLDVINDISIVDVRDRLSEMFYEGSEVLSIVYPNEQKDKVL